MTPFARRGQMNVSNSCLWIFILFLASLVHFVANGICLILLRCRHPLMTKQTPKHVNAHSLGKSCHEFECLPLFINKRNRGDRATISVFYSVHFGHNFTTHQTMWISMSCATTKTASNQNSHVCQFEMEKSIALPLLIFLNAVSKQQTSHHTWITTTITTMQMFCGNKLP